jgi:hypothetical protein
MSNNETTGDRESVPDGSIGEKEKPWSWGAGLVPEDTTDIWDVIDRFTTTELTVDDDFAARLQNPDPGQDHRFQVTTPQSAMSQTIRVQPSHQLLRDQQQQQHSNYHRPGRRIPSKLPRLLQTIKRLGKKWGGHVNTSALFAFEIRRPYPRDLQFQLVVPREDMANAARGTLRSELPGTTFDDGVDGLPVAAGDRVAACTVTPGSWDWLPLNTDHERPALTDLVLRLHHHLHENCRVHVQLLFKPLQGRTHPEKKWRNTARQAISQALGYSNDEGQTGSYSRRRARGIEAKTNQLLFQTAIRIVVATPDARRELPVGALYVRGSRRLIGNPDCRPRKSVGEPLSLNPPI